MAASLISQLEKLLASSACFDDPDVDYCKDEPGYAEFMDATDCEYETRNYGKAKRLYTRASELGHPMAQCNLALWYLEGNRAGTPKNLKKAFELFRSAADKNIGFAQYNLSVFYYSGKGGIVPKDFGKAFELAKESIKDIRVQQMRQGDPYMLLGKMEMSGDGCTKNVRKALKCFEKAAEFGHTAATPDFLRMVRMLLSTSPVDHQRESDTRWDRMCAWVDQNPDEKPNTMRDHLNVLTKFGFGISKNLTEKQLDIEGGFDKFMEVSGGMMHTLDNYEMEDEPVAPKKCDHCGKVGAKKKCGSCGESYCDRTCQKKAWKDHKRICRIVQFAQS